MRIHSTSLHDWPGWFCVAAASELPPPEFKRLCDAAPGDEEGGMEVAMTVNGVPVPVLPVLKRIMEMRQAEVNVAAHQLVIAQFSTLMQCIRTTLNGVEDAIKAKMKEAGIEFPED
jgi:hypothetical protein